LSPLCRHSVNDPASLRTAPVIASGSARSTNLGIIATLAMMICAMTVCLPLHGLGVVRDGTAEDEWLTSGGALDRALSQMKPLFIVLELDSDEDTNQRIKEILSDSGAKKSLSQTIWLKDRWEKIGDRWSWKSSSDDMTDKQRSVEQSARKRLEKLLHASGGKTVVAIFDPYLENGTLLQAGKLRSANLRKAIRASVKLSSAYQRSRTVTRKQLDKAQGFVQDSKHPEALRLLTQSALFKFPPIEPLLKRRDQLLEILHGRWKEARAEARELEHSNKLGEAAAKLETILKEYPHPEWDKQIREDVGRVWRRIQGPLFPGASR